LLVLLAKAAHFYRQQGCQLAAQVFNMNARASIDMGGYSLVNSATFWISAIDSSCYILDVDGVQSSK